MSNDALLVPTFRVNVAPNAAESAKQGRPIFQEMEVCEIRFAADKQKVAVFPAHEAEPNATRERGETVTYAMLYADQYRKFKAEVAQDVSGTPLAEAPFLTEAKRRELKALNIHTVEALAALDGTPLKQLGMGGREFKNQAQAYLDNARGSADVTAMAAEIAALRQQIADRDDFIRATNAAAKGGANLLQTIDQDDPADHPEDETKQLDDLTDAELKAYIKEQTGEPVRGNPNRDTLIERALEIATSPKAA